MYLHCYVYVWHSSATLSEVFPCFFLSYKGKTRKDGAQPALFQIVVQFMYCLFCVVPCIVCV